MLGSIPASTVVDLPAPSARLLATCERLVDQQIPNLFRLYLNPHVAQACYCLTHMVQEIWPATHAASQYQVFLANGFEEALSGAIKLARHELNANGRPHRGLILDPQCRLSHFAHTDVGDLGRIFFIPEVVTACDPKQFAALLGSDAPQTGWMMSSLVDERAVEQAFCQTHTKAGVHLQLRSLRATDLQPAQQSSALPEIVVFDDSFTSGEVPFGAFVASKRLFRRWNKRGMSSFHSTTYQPNSISTLHLVRTLESQHSAFFARHRAALHRIESNLSVRRRVFKSLYSASLTRLIDASGIPQHDVRARGHYVQVGTRRIFDGVAGVACSVRGHNPPGYPHEVGRAFDTPPRIEVAARLAERTGLSHMAPAVSGASAVEHALKLGLASQFPRDYVLALRGGFGGKTLFALTGTARPALKAGLDPLYPHVVYADPFATDAAESIKALFRRYPVGVVQLELIQGVGGVRPIPQPIIQLLQEMRARHRCLLFVDEIQTGLFRTGPFVRCSDVQLKPDLLTLGKGTSDMMFPFALTLYSQEVYDAVLARHCSLPQVLEERYGYELGYRTLLNTLCRAEEIDLESQVRARGAYLQRLLAEELRACPHVLDVRCFGLLAGIELATQSASRRLLKRLLTPAYLLAMIGRSEFPTLMGFCQYEPSVLKFTPPLSATDDELRAACNTIGAVLSTPLPRLLTQFGRHLSTSALRRTKAAR